MGGFTDEELEGLSEEERAALKEEDDDDRGKGDGDHEDVDGSDGKDGQDNQDDGQDDNKGGQGDVDGDDKGKTQDDDDKGGDQGVADDADNDQQGADSAQDVNTSVIPPFQLSTSGKTTEEIDAELTKLDEQFEEGEIPLKDYNAQRDALTREKWTIETYADINKQVATQTIENNWKKAQQDFFEDNEQYRDNPDLNVAFVNRVNKLLATDEGKKMSDRVLLQKAKEALEESLGFGKGKAKEEGSKGDTGKEALAAAKKKEAEKGRDGKSLHDIPKSQEFEGGDKFDALDKLDGEEFEKAVAALTDAERKAYARRG